MYDHWEQVEKKYAKLAIKNRWTREELPNYDTPWFDEFKNKYGVSTIYSPPGSNKVHTKCEYNNNRKVGHEYIYHPNGQVHIHRFHGDEFTKPFRKEWNKYGNLIDCSFENFSCKFRVRFGVQQLIKITHHMTPRITFRFSETDNHVRCASYGNINAEYFSSGSVRIWDSDHIDGVYFTGELIDGLYINKHRVGKITDQEEKDILSGIEANVNTISSSTCTERMDIKLMYGVDLPIPFMSCNQMIKIYKKLAHNNKRCYYTFVSEN